MKTKKLHLVVSSIALATLALASAEDKPEAPKGRPEGPGGFDKGKGKGPGDFLRTMDKDGDKSISKEEAGERWERLGKLDKNNDGKVSPDEFAAAAPGGPGGPGGRFEPGEMFKRGDKNSDGKITKDEVPGEAWERMSKMDKNNDGAVSKEEAEAARAMFAGKGGPGGPDRGRFFEEMDKNKDGKVTQEEAPQAWERIGRMDADKDGAVTKEELAKGFAAMARDGKGDGKGGFGGPGAMMERMDKNKDGKLSKDEVPEEMWARISKADEDADGNVSKAELEKVMNLRPGGDAPDKPKRPAVE